MTKSNFISLLTAGSRDETSKDVLAVIQQRGAGDTKEGAGRRNVLRDDYMLNPPSSLKVCTSKYICHAIFN